LWIGRPQLSGNLLEARRIENMGYGDSAQKLSSARSQEEVVEHVRLLKQVVNEAAGEKTPEA